MSNTTHAGSEHTPNVLRQINREVGAMPLFDPHAGTVIAAPLGDGPGWWAGAPGAAWIGNRLYVVYRVRRPQPVRGGETRIAVSDNGEQFDVIWTATKDAFGSPSIERSALAQADNGTWRLYVSYVDGDDGRWRIDLLEAATPDAFDPAARRPVLTAATIGAEGVKDPWICRIGGIWHMIVSYAPTPDQLPEDRNALHATRDIYNTGYTRSLSGLATSFDGLEWNWHGAIMTPPDHGWDRYAARLNAAVRVGGMWIGFYDGSASVEENYEERCGLAVSADLRSWQRVSIGGPALGAARGPGSMRYVDVVQTEDWLRYFYEYTRPDGAHELRTCHVPLRP